MTEAAVPLTVRDLTPSVSSTPLLSEHSHWFWEPFDTGPSAAGIADREAAISVPRRKSAELAAIERVPPPSGIANSRPF